VISFWSIWAGVFFVWVSAPLAMSTPRGEWARACGSVFMLIPPARRNGCLKFLRSLWFADSPLPGSVLSNSMYAQCGKYFSAWAMSFLVFSLIVLITGFWHFFTKLKGSSPDSWMKSRCGASALICLIDWFWKTPTLWMFVVALQISMALLVVMYLLLVGTKLRPMKSTPMSSQNFASLVVLIPQIFNFGVVRVRDGFFIREVPTNTALMFFGRDWMSFFEKMPLSETIVMCFGMCFAIFFVLLRSTLKVFKSLLLMPMILTGVLRAFLSSGSV